MGYVRHNMIMVVASDYIFKDWCREDLLVPNIDAFRESLPEEVRHLVVGPIPSVSNGYLTYIFCPDGSKEGWATSNQMEIYQRQFLDLFSFAYEDGSSPFDVLVVAARFGSDEPGAGMEDELIVRSNIPNIKMIGKGDA